MELLEPDLCGVMHNTSTDVAVLIKYPVRDTLNAEDNGFSEPCVSCTKKGLPQGMRCGSLMGKADLFHFWGRENHQFRRILGRG